MTFSCRCTPNVAWFDNLSKSSLILSSPPQNPLLLGKAWSESTSGATPSGWQDRLYDASAWADPDFVNLNQIPCGGSGGIWTSFPPVSGSEIVSFRKASFWDPTTAGPGWLYDQYCSCYQLRNMPALLNAGLTITVYTRGVLLGCWLDGVAVTLTEVAAACGDVRDHKYQNLAVDLSIINDQAAERFGVGAANPCITSKPPLLHAIALQVQAVDAATAGVRWSVHAEGQFCIYSCHCPGGYGGWEQ